MVINTSKLLGDTNELSLPWKVNDKTWYVKTGRIIHERKSESGRIVTEFVGGTRTNDQAIFIVKAANTYFRSYELLKRVADFLEKEGIAILYETETDGLRTDDIRYQLKQMEL